MGQVKFNIDAFNIKKIDRDVNHPPPRCRLPCSGVSRFAGQAYGLSKNEVKVVVKCGDQEVVGPTKRGLDGTWEHDAVFSADESSTITAQLVVRPGRFRSCIASLEHGACRSTTRISETLAFSLLMVL
jgi:hypothetical protein